MGLPYRPPVLTRDNRLQGLMRELLEALADCDDPSALYRAGKDLKAIGDAARSKGYELQPRGSRTW